MQSKPIAAITVLLLVVASLLVSGCTSPTSNTNQTTSAATQHDAFLENYMAAFKTGLYSHNDEPVLAWEANWINSTSVSAHITVLNKTTNKTTYDTSTFTVFPTSQDATNYVNAVKAMDNTGYLLYRTEPRGGVSHYVNVTGHAPQIYKEYVWNEGTYTSSWIIQIDNLVRLSTINYLSSRE